MSPRDFTLVDEFIRLDQLLKAADLVSTGGEAKIRIQEGEIMVDGEVEIRRGRKIRAGMRVQLEDEIILVHGAAPEASP